MTHIQVTRVWSIFLDILTKLKVETENKFEGRWKKKNI